MADFDDLRRAMELCEACPHAPGECEECDEYREFCIRHAPALLAALSARDKRIEKLERALREFLDCEDGGAVLVHPGTDEDNTRLDVSTEAWDGLHAALTPGAANEGSDGN